jgi:hypothetical protein
MTEQKLNGAQIRSGFQQVGSEAVPQGVGMDAFVESRPLSRLPDCVEYAPGIDGDFHIAMRAFAGEQKRRRFGIGSPPVLSKFSEQSWG